MEEEEDERKRLQRAHQLTSPTTATGEVLRRQPLDLLHVTKLFFYLFFFFFKPFSYHNLEHGAEDLGVLCHTANVESPAEDWGVVVLIAYFNKDLGCVGCKTKNKSSTSTAR